MERPTPGTPYQLRTNLASLHVPAVLPSAFCARIWSNVVAKCISPSRRGTTIVRGIGCCGPRWLATGINFKRDKTVCAWLADFRL